MPVLADLAKETMVYGVPFRTAWRIMAYGHLKPITVGQLCLQALLPGTAAVAVTSPGISHDK